MKRSGSSACTSYDSAAVGKGDFGKMNCNWKRHYSQRQVSVSDLPVSLSLRCDSNDNIHAGFDSVKGRTSGYHMPWGNIECQNGKVNLDWLGTKKTHTLKKNSDVVKIELGKDRQTKFYLNDKHVQTGKTAIPASKFPVDWEFSSADASGYMRGVQWLGQKKGTRPCLHRSRRAQPPKRPAADSTHDSTHCGLVGCSGFSLPPGAEIFSSNFVPQILIATGATKIKIVQRGQQGLRQNARLTPAT